MDKVLVVAGPTATGKTALAVSLAHLFNGEIINADSRQVYRGMDIGTGKDLPSDSKFEIRNSKFNVENPKLNVGYREKEGIPVWLVDIVDPDYLFNVGEYVRLARMVVADIHSRGKLPILVGGTGLYIRSLLSVPDTVFIPPSPGLRVELSKLPVDSLAERLKVKDPLRWQTMNASDRKNPRRLVRAIEVAYARNERMLVDVSEKKNAFNVLSIGLRLDKETLKERIKVRVGKRMQEGIVKEIQALLDKGYGWQLPSFSAIGYRQWQGYFGKKKTPDECIAAWEHDEYQYASRQMTWFAKEKNIHWFDVSSSGYTEVIEQEIRAWYTSTS